MTEEKAASLLSWIEVDKNGMLYVPTWYLGIGDDLHEALNMAISALKKEYELEKICGDKVRRIENAGKQ